MHCRLVLPYTTTDLKIRLEHFQAGAGDCGSHSQQIWSSTIVILDKEMKAGFLRLSPSFLFVPLLHGRGSVSSGTVNVENETPSPCLAAAGHLASWPYVPLKWPIIHFNSTSGCPSSTGPDHHHRPGVLVSDAKY